jgi:hypothetical protein
MQTGGGLYLLLVIVATTGFALVLAYYAAQQARRDRAKATDKAKTRSSAAPHGTPSHA